MSSGANYFLKKALGDDFLESLTKFELWKPGTRTTVDHEEIKTALQIVPRVLMAMLIRELSSMEIGETKELNIPVDTVPAMVRVTKHERDVYSGEIEQENKKVVDFKYRSIPGVGLVIMSAFELYDTSALVQEDQKTSDTDSAKIQQLIDERLALHDLVEKVVDKKIEQKDAIKQLLLEKINQDLHQNKVASDIANITEIASSDPAAKTDEYMRGMANGLQVANSAVNDKEPQFLEAPKKRQSPLKSFLDNKKEKSKPKPIEFSVEMAKGEHVDCPDCGKNIFDGQLFSGCICLGDDMDKKVYIKKSEEGIKIRFGRGWDAENIEMLLEVLRRKRG